MLIWEHEWFLLALPLAVDAFASFAKLPTTLRLDLSSCAFWLHYFHLWCSKSMRLERHCFPSNRTLPLLMLDTYLRVRKSLRAKLLFSQKFRVRRFSLRPAPRGPIEIMVDTEMLTPVHLHRRTCCTAVKGVVSRQPPDLSSCRICFSHKEPPYPIRALPRAACVARWLWWVVFTLELIVGSTKALSSLLHK